MGNGNWRDRLVHYDPVNGTSGRSSGNGHRDDNKMPIIIFFVLGTSCHLEIQIIVMTLGSSLGSTVREASFFHRPILLRIYMDI